MDILKKETPELIIEHQKTLEKNSEVGNFFWENKNENFSEGQNISEEKQPSPVSSGNQGVGMPGIDQTKSPFHQSLEAILEEDLENLYFSMPEKKQQEFKIKGEQTAQQIAKLVTTAKATFKKVFKLILNWLKIIPGVNKYFLEQEAKIKADRILEIK